MRRAWSIAEVYAIVAPAKRTCSVNRCCDVRSEPNIGSGVFWSNPRADCMVDDILLSISDQNVVV
jgi:hypothetical protein